MAISLSTSRDWPPSPEDVVWQGLTYLAALRDGDENAVRAAAIQRRMGGDRRKPYVHTPLPALLTRVIAGMLFGEEPRFVAADERDQEALNRIIAVNQLPAELMRAAIISVSEGEVWGRVSADPAFASAPVIDFHSRRAVIPVWRGRFLVEATLVSEFPGQRDQQVYRLMETHRAGEVESRLYLGSRDRKGKEVSLDAIPQTAGVQPLVMTGVDRPLLVRIANRLGADPRLGESDLAAIEPLLLSLNEALTVTGHNLRLTGQKRLLVDRDVTDQHGNFDLGLDITVLMSGGMPKLGAEGAHKPVEQLEYSFESGDLTRWLDWVLDHTLTVAGVSPASVGRGELGGSLSGTALKLRMNHTLSEVASKGRHYDAGVAELLQMAQLLDARSQAEGGFGQIWVAAEEAPRMERGDGLAPDQREEAQVIAQLSAADAISTEEKVRRLNPGWDDQRVAVEVEAIASGTAPLMIDEPGA